MSELSKNAIAFLQKRFPSATVLSGEQIFADKDGETVLRIYPMIAHDMHSGVKQRAVAIESLGSLDEMESISQYIGKILEDLDGSAYIKMGNAIKPTGHDIDTHQMTFAPRIILYTNKLCTSINQVISTFGKVNLMIEVVDESEMHKTLFVSYGGPDQEKVSHINKRIVAKGVKTWFFPDDALPGEKLHRMMHDGVNRHDRVLLVCSEAALTRAGVLNEIERVLEREAKEGGSDILIPIALDDFVYDDWAPGRANLANQVRARVITKIDFNNEEGLEEQIGKIVSALRR